MQSFQYSQDRYRFFIDVPEGEMSWIQHYHKVSAQYRDAVDFHLRSSDEVSGAGWDIEKLGKTTHAFDPNEAIIEFGTGNR